MVFLLTDLFEIKPVCNRSERRRAGILFTGTAKQKLVRLYIWIGCRLTIKQSPAVNETAKWRQPRLISTWIHSSKNDGQNQKVSSASAARGKLFRASSQDNSFKPQQAQSTKLSHPINLLFKSQLTRIAML